MARPVGVVGSRASVNETKPTPRCSSSAVAKSATDLPQRSSATPHDVDFPAARRLQQLPCEKHLHRFPGPGQNVAGFFAFGKARFTAKSERHLTMAETFGHRNS